MCQVLEEIDEWLLNDNKAFGKRVTDIKNVSFNFNNLDQTNQ